MKRVADFRDRKPLGGPRTVDFWQNVGRIGIVQTQRGVAFMIDALFWYTGVAAWVMIVLASASMLAAEVNDRARRRSVSHD